MLKWATMSPALNQLAQLSINRELGYVDQYVRLRELTRQVELLPVGRAIQGQFRPRT
jgi:hypothetical protein